MPAVRFEPMLATPWPDPFDDPEWAFEPKWDGVRIIARSGRLTSRRGNDATAGYPEIDLSTLGDVVLDGEIVAFDADGRPSFELLQQRINVRSGRRVGELAATIPVHYLVFDLLAAGEPIMDRPWSERRARLADLDLPAAAVLSSAIVGSGVALFEASAGEGLEGIVAKRRASTYQPGHRSPDWRKIVHVARTRAVVGGFTPGSGGRAGGFGGLLLGMWDGSGLRFCGSVGSGFDGPAVAAIRAALDEMTTDHSPFHPDPALPADATFVFPHLVAEVAFKQWTSAGRLRAPSFKGFSDRPAESVTWSQDGPEG